MEENQRYQELIDFIDEHPGCLIENKEDTNKKSFDFEVGYEF